MKPHKSPPYDAEFVDGLQNWTELEIETWVSSFEVEFPIPFIFIFAVSTVGTIWE